jgi:hypothetical protein
MDFRTAEMTLVADNFLPLVDSTHKSAPYESFLSC